jgi:hypothetical protein
LFVTLFPALIFAFPGWLWMTREVLTLTPGAMQLRRELWRIGHTREYDIKKVRNFRVEELAIRGFRHTIVFDYDLDLGVSHEFGKNQCRIRHLSACPKVVVFGPPRAPVPSDAFVRVHVTVVRPASRDFRVLSSPDDPLV